MSDNKDESQSPVGISDDQLPDDLVPSEDNPLAEGLPDGETVDGMLEGKGTDDTDDDEQADGQADGQADDRPSEDSGTEHDS